MDRRTDWRSLAAGLGETALRIPKYVKLCTALWADHRMPARHKILLAAAALYGFSPVDLIPGFIPVLGQLDDLLVLLLGIRYALQQVPPLTRDRYLLKAGLSRREIEEDRDRVQQALAAVAREAGRLAWTGGLWGARQGVRAASFALQSGARAGVAGWRAIGARRDRERCQPQAWIPNRARAPQDLDR